MHPCRPYIPQEGRTAHRGEFDTVPDSLCSLVPLLPFLLLCHGGHFPRLPCVQEASQEGSGSRGHAIYLWIQASIHIQGTKNRTLFISQSNNKEHLFVSTTFSFPGHTPSFPTIHIHLAPPHPLPFTQRHPAPPSTYAAPTPFRTTLHTDHQHHPPPHTNISSSQQRHSGKY